MLIVSKGTHEDVTAALEFAVKTGQRIRLWYGSNGISWEQEDWVTGRIKIREGRPYLYQNSTSKKGQFIPTNHIVKLIIGSAEVNAYTHAQFTQPTYEVNEVYEDGDFPYWVMDGQRIVKRFSDPLDAHRWIEFMKGMRMNASGRKS